MRIRNTIVAMLAVLGLTGIALAHEGHHHDAMGTIETLGTGHIVLKIAEDTSEEFTLTDDTIFTRGTEAVTHEDVEIGERAVVTYEKKGGSNMALEVKLAPQGPQE